ncbi:Ig-like domain-containing protein [Diplocloster hominis]|uniref:Ig-like domain-containing protein n=1 Tax=Diplocloster hominis TaxID=3079010 RepID=UPI0031BA93F4
MRLKLARYLRISLAGLLSAVMLLGGGMSALAAPEKDETTPTPEEERKEEQPEIREEDLRAMASVQDIVLDGSRSIAFNEDWLFHYGDEANAKNKEYDDADWKELSLPHDWSVEFAFDEHSPGGSNEGFLNGGTGWYRKHFVLPPSMQGKTVTIDFGGVYMDSSVYVNGTYVGNHPYGYSPFSYDITDLLAADGVTENVIAVKAVNDQPTCRWYAGSGIYRSVNLTVTQPVHVKRYGTYVTMPDIEQEYGNGTVNVQVRTTVSNDKPAETNAVVKTTVYDAAGKSASETVESESTAIPAGESSDYQQTVPVAKPKLWDNDHPNLYYVLTEVVEEGVTVDTYKTDFGFRWYQFDPDHGFSLNGKSMKLFGVCMHHDQGSLGAAANYRAIERQMETMKEMGVNAIRVTHNPAADELLDICNKMGLLVIDEAFDCWESSKRTNDYGRFFDKAATDPSAEPGMTWAEFDIKTMVDRGKNNPCIIAWSIGNEISGISVQTAKNLNRWVKEIDPTRYTVQGFNNWLGGFDPNGTAAKVADESDIAGFNYAEHNYDTAHAAYPDWIILGTETASATRSRGVYAHPGVERVADNHDDMQQSSYDVDRVSWGSTIQTAWKEYRDREFIAGEFMWTGFDYLGEPTPYFNRWPAKSSYFGAVDTCGFPKDAFYIYQSIWTSVKENPMVHIIPHWNWEEGEEVVLNIYSNAPKVELFLNGETLGEKEFLQKTTDYGMDYQEAADGNIYLTWKVPFEAGTLKAVAKDADDNIIAEDIQQTAGEAAGIKLTPDRTVITADGRDLSYITVDILDKDGNFVPTADNMVNFRISGNGKIVGVDNGNAIAVDELYKDNKRKAFSGKALVIVQSTKDAGSFTLSASSVGLKGSQTTCFTIAEESRDLDVLLGYEIPTVTANIGEEVALPETVKAVYNLSGSRQLAVRWEPIPDGSADKAGSFTVNGQVADTGDTVRITVKMVGVATIREYRGVTPIGVIPELPKTAMVVYTDGTQREAGVVWDGQISAEDVAQEKVLQLTGTVTGITAMKAQAYIRVGQQVYPTLLISRNEKNTGLPKATCSYASGTDPAEKAIDGVIGSSSRWTNWRSGGGSVGDDWIAIEFDDTYEISSMDVYFFTSYDTVIPERAVVEYKNEQGAWTQVANQDKVNRADFGTEGFTKNTIAFDPVQAKEIRLHIYNTTKANSGVSEIEVFAPAKTPSVIPDTDVTLESITVDGEALDGFDPERSAYTMELTYAQPIPQVSASLPEGSNASLLIVQADDKNGTAVVEVTAEDNVTKKAYYITYTELPPLLKSAELSLETEQIKENETGVLTIKALLEDGEPVAAGTLDEIRYTVTNVTGEGEVINGRFYAYQAGAVEIKVSVTYQGTTVESSPITIDIAVNPEPQIITSYEAVQVETKKGEKPVLPDRIRATFDNGFTKYVDVVWDEIKEEQYAQYGEFIVSGTVDRQGKRPEAKVIVNGLLGVQNFSAATPLGTAPALPAKARLYYSDGTTDDVDVTWDAYDRELLKEEQTFTVFGTVGDAQTRDGGTLRTCIQVRVSADTAAGDNLLGYLQGYYWPRAVASYTNSHPMGNDRIDAINDNLVSYGNDPVNRWTNYVSPARGGDWVAVIMGKDTPQKKFVDNLDIDFYRDSGGTEFPESYEIQYLVTDTVETPMDEATAKVVPSDHMLNDDANWANVENLTGPDAIPENDTAHFTFDTVETYAIRIKMEAQSGKYLGITEMSAYEKLVESYDDFNVQNILVDGNPVPNFANETLQYAVQTERETPEIRAEVDNNASVTLIQSGLPGTPAKLIVTAENGVNSRTYELNLNLQKPVTDIRFDRELYEVPMSRTQGMKLQVTVLPADAADPSLTWKVEPANIADVKNGMLIPKEPGEGKVTATAGNGVSGSVNVKVVDDRVTADKQKLEELIGQAQALQKRPEYTEAVKEAKAELEAALEEALACMGDDNATQQTVNERCVRLSEAIEKIGVKPDKSKLQELLREAGDKDLSKYTQDTADVLKGAVEFGQVVFHDKTSGFARVEEAVKRLTDALGGLKEKDPAKPGEDDQNKDDQNKDDQNSNNQNSNNNQSSGDKNGSDDSGQNSSGGNSVSQTPQTGDDSPTGAFILILMLAGLAGAGVFVRDRVKRSQTGK